MPHPQSESKLVLKTDKWLCGPTTRELGPSAKSELPVLQIFVQFDDSMRSVIMERLPSSTFWGVFTGAAADGQPRVVAYRKRNVNLSASRELLSMPPVRGTVPAARSRHTAAALGSKVRHRWFPSIQFAYSYLCSCT